MRPTLVLAFASTWSWAAAFGIRGAAERALFFASYLAEEVWEDDAKYTVATTCVGTRPHLRLGSTKMRCSLEEFLLHVWEPTVANLIGHDGRAIRDANNRVVKGPDSRPDPAAMQRYWDNSMNSNSKKVENADILNMRNAIRGYKEAQVVGGPPPNPLSTNPRPANSFTGNLRPGSIFDGLDYYETMAQIGNKLQPTRDRITEVLNTARPNDPLTDAQRKFEDVTKPLLRKWQKQVELGAEAVKWLRIADDSKHSNPGIKSRLQPPMEARFFKTKPTMAPVFTDEHGRAFELGIGTWNAADRDATIREAMRNSVSQADAEAGYDRAAADWAATPDAQQHRLAINGIDASIAAFRC